MRRRDFVSIVGMAVVSAPLGARAQSSSPPVVAFLADGTPEGFAPRIVAVRRGLSDMGFIDGQNFVLVSRLASGNYNLLPELVADLVRQQVSVIVTAGSEKVTQIAKNATATIPIVAVLAGDPVSRGLVTSVNRPGGNLTVVSFFTSSDNALVAKRLELLHEVVPKVATIGWLVDSNILDYDDELRDLMRVAQMFGIEVKLARVPTQTDIESAFTSLIQDGVGAMLETGPVFFDNRERIVTLAARAPVPILYEWRTFVDEGGLMSYGSNNEEIFRQAGVYAGRILKGEKVGDLPVVQPSRIELIINLKTARTLNLKISPTLIARADEVIE